MTEAKPRQRKRGPNTKPMANMISDETRGQILRLLQAGATFEQAAQAAHVSDRTLRRWRQTGREIADKVDAGTRLTAREQVYLDFLDAVDQAIAQYEVAAVGQIQRAGAEGDWRAVAWLLERRFPDRYLLPAGRRDRSGQGMGRPVGATSAPDRKKRGSEPDRIRLRVVK